MRLKSKGGRQSSVVFCTNGVLLRVLVGKGGGSSVPDITHIIVVTHFCLIYDMLFMCLESMLFLVSLVGVNLIE